MMNRQNGAGFLGFILGLVVGLTVALVVALYLTQMPSPLSKKDLNRPAELDTAESLKNKDWDPNAPLYGKNPARPSTAEPVLPAASGAVAGAGHESKPAANADPLGNLVKAKEVAAKGAVPAQVGSGALIYFVQAGAYGTMQDAESQRAKLSLTGIDAKISERDQAGRVVFRVRVGPLQTRDQADSVKAKIDATGIESVLVRVQR